MKNVRRFLPTFLLATFLLATATLVAVPCLAAPTPAKPAPGPASGASQSFSGMSDSKNSIEYKSPEGNFQVTYPTGCARLHTRTNVRPGDGTELAVQVVYVTCDRAGATNEGCAVFSQRGAARGLKGQAAADKVLSAVTEQMKGYGVNPVRQTALRRDFGKRGVVEGIDIQAQRADGAGDFWIRGLLSGEDIYMVVAWKAAGGLWNGVEYQRFFDSFRPWAE